MNGEKGDIFGPTEADHWEFYEGMFDLKGTFTIELANIITSTKTISNQSEVMSLLTNLENVLAGRNKQIEKLYEDIGGLSKLTFTQDTFFFYDDSKFINKTFIIELNTYVSIYGSIFILVILKARKK